MLSSKKTYILMALAILTAWATYFTGDTTLAQAIAATFAALGGITLRQGITTEAAKTVGKVVPLLLAFVVLVGCATSPQTATQPATIKPAAELGQGRTAATAAFYKSAATSEKDASLAPESRAVGGEVSVPFALWSPETKSWQIPLDANGKPYLVTATAVRDFTYIVAGTVSNSATVSGTASGSQTQGGTAGATSGQTATPTTTVSPTTDVSLPVK